MNPTQVRPLADLLRLGSGPIVWFAHFSINYGAEAVICRAPADAGGATLWLSAATTAAAMAVLAWSAARAWRRQSAAAVERQTDAEFLRRASLLLTYLAALAVLWTAFPTMVVPACH